MATSATQAILATVLAGWFMLYVGLRKKKLELKRRPPRRR